MPKRLLTETGFIVRFNKKGKLVFWITHPDIKDSDRDPIIVSPEDLASLLSAFAIYLRNPARNREGFRKHWHRFTEYV